MLSSYITYFCWIVEPNAFAPELKLENTDGKRVDVYKGFILTNEDTVSLVPELAASDKDEVGGARKLNLRTIGLKSACKSKIKVLNEWCGNTNGMFYTFCYLHFILLAMTWGCLPYSEFKKILVNILETKRYALFKSGHYNTEGSMCCA